MLRSARAVRTINAVDSIMAVTSPVTATSPLLLIDTRARAEKRLPMRSVALARCALGRGRGVAMRGQRRGGGGVHRDRATALLYTGRNG